jgi:WD40 repeat protein
VEKPEAKMTQKTLPGEVGRVSGASLPLTDNPYIGPRPFTTQEGARFYGREQESSQLLSLVIAERLVLFYAQSGAGKSSLINARLIPGLEERNFRVLTGRVNGQTLESTEAANIFTYNLILSLEQNEALSRIASAQPLENLRLSDYFGALEVENVVEPAQELETQLLLDAPQIFSGVRPLALIVDQFEEIFTTNPGAWAQRGPFFEQLCAAMQEDPYLWVVLVIREDYVAALDPFANLLPGRLRARFYMQRMGFIAAMEAVKKPVENLRPFEANAARELVDNLSLIVTGKDASDQPIYELGQFVEPVQLQVVCFQLWEELRGDPGTTITAANLQRLAAGKNLASFISDALALFYQSAIEDVCKQFPQVSERRLREWFSRELITEAETRGAVVQGKERTGAPPNALPNPVVYALQNHFVIRAEIRGGNTWYELSHDRFVAPILQSNRLWADQNSLPVEADAQKWDETRNSTLLYDGRQLSEAVFLLNGRPDELSETAKVFIRTSQDISRAKERRRQRIAFGVLSALLLLSLVLAVLAVNNAFRAVQQQNTAEAASTIAVEQKLLVETASTAVVQQREVAVNQRHTAEAASTVAVEQQLRAETASTAVAQQREVAVQQQKIAEVASTKAIEEEAIAKTAEANAMAANVRSQSSRLASLADYFRVIQPDLSMLLAIRSVNVYDNWESRRSLLESIQNGLATQVQAEGFSWFIDDYKPNPVVFSPDGRYLAVGLDNGTVILNPVDKRSPKRALPAERALAGPVNSISFNSTGDLLAIAGVDRMVTLWRLGDTPEQDSFETFPSFPITGAYYPIHAVAIQPGGNGIALATAQDDVSGKLLLFDLNNLSGGSQFADECQQANCLSLAWSPDGMKLAFGDSKGAIKILEVTGTAAPTIAWTKEKAHADQVKAIVFYPDNQHMVSGGLDLRLYEWDTSALGSNPIYESRREDTPPVFSLALDPSGRYLVVGGNDPIHVITIWDANTLERENFPGLLNAHTQPVQSIAFSAQGNRFASASSDQFIKVWSFQPIDPLSTLAWMANAPGRTQAVGVDQGGKTYVAQAAASQVIVWRKDQKDPVFTLDQAYKSIAFQSAGDQLAFLLGSDNGEVKVLDAANGSVLAGPLPVAPGKTIRAVAASSDLKMVAAAACSGENSCSEIYLADIQSGGSALFARVETQAQELINALSFRSDGAVLAVGTSFGRILIYDLASRTFSTEAATEGLRLSTAQLSISSLAYSPQEAGLLIAGLYDGRIAMWEAGSGDPISAFDERMTLPDVTGLAFYKEAENGWVLFSSGAMGEVRRWEIDQSAWIRRGCEKLKNSDSSINLRASSIYADTSVENVCK